METKKYEISSAHNLFPSITVTVYKGKVIESSLNSGVEYGADFESLKKYWEKFEGENKYIIKQL